VGCRRLISDLRFSGFILYPLSFFFYSPFNTSNDIRDIVALPEFKETFFSVFFPVFDAILHDQKKNNMDINSYLKQSFKSTVVNQNEGSLKITFTNPLTLYRPGV